MFRNTAPVLGPGNHWLAGSLPAVGKPETADPRLLALLARKPTRVASVAMANKMARVV